MFFPKYTYTYNKEYKIKIGRYYYKANILLLSSKSKIGEMYILYYRLIIIN